MKNFTAVPECMLLVREEDLSDPEGFYFHGKVLLLLQGRPINRDTFEKIDKFNALFLLPAPSLFYSKCSFGEILGKSGKITFLLHFPAQ